MERTVKKAGVIALKKDVVDLAGISLGEEMFASLMATSPTKVVDKSRKNKAAEVMTDVAAQLAKGKISHNTLSLVRDDVLKEQLLVDSSRSFVNVSCKGKKGNWRFSLRQP